MFIYIYNLYLNYIDQILDCSVSDKQRKICQSNNSESQKIQNIKSKQFCDNSKNKQ